MSDIGGPPVSKILEASRKIITRRGYSNFSYADVAAAVSLHKATIHHHFPTKADLAFAVVKYSSSIFTADMAALASSGLDPVAQLRAYLEYWEKLLVRDNEEFCVAGMLGAEVPFLRKDVAEAVAAYFGTFTAWLEQLLESGIETGHFYLEDSVKTEAAALLSLVYGATLVARAIHDPDHFKTVTAPAFRRLTRRTD